MPAPVLPADYNTENFSLVGEFIQDLLQETTSLGLQDVFYGDQELIPRTPAVAVETGIFTRQLDGIPYRTKNVFRIYLLVYFAKVQDVQVTRLQCDQKAEQIMRTLHQNKTMGGLVISGHVTAIEPGYTYRGRALMRSARITWEGLTKNNA